MLLHKDSPWMPSFSKSHTKYMAREVHIGCLYHLFTGNLKIPDNKSYWYLCNDQDNTEGSEIYQLTKKIRLINKEKYVFVTPSQCYGVDRSKIIIRNNKRRHPTSNWICAEWDVAIQDQQIFDPALVYLDTTSFANKKPAVEVLKKTLRHCKKDTLLIANVMMNNSRAGNGEKVFDKNALIDNFLDNEHPNTFAGWNKSPENPEINIFHSYEYKTSKTLMRSYVFFKGVLPQTKDVIAKFNSFKDWCSLSTKESFATGK